MAYSTNPNLPKARALGVQLLVQNRLPVQTVANRCGVHRSTIWRWKRKWDKLNEHVQLTNDNRPTRLVGLTFRLTACAWRIPTLTSRPHHCFDDSRRKRVRSDNPKRPLVTKPGELVQTDTIHYICPLTKRRRYVYTVIDLYSRTAYAEVHGRIGPGIAAKVVGRASERFGFVFHLVQADNGPEFGRCFAQRIATNNTSVRHSRLGRPNDNAHIERFNRTIQDECLGNRLTYRTTNKVVQARLTAYLDYYNTKRVHLGIQYRTPLEMLQSF